MTLLIEYPNMFFEDDSKNLNIDLNEISSESSIKTASIEELSKRIVSTMISSVKDDIKNNLADSSKNKNKK